MARPILFTISGISCVGKTTLVKALTASIENMPHILTCTTRPPRKDEMHLKDYMFIKPDNRLWASNSMLSIRKKDGYIYGLTANDLVLKFNQGYKKAICVLDVKGALSLKYTLESNKFTDNFAHNILMAMDVEIKNILILSPSIAFLKDNLRKRNVVFTGKNLLELNEQSQNFNNFEYVTVNGDLKETVKRLKTFIKTCI